MQVVTNRKHTHNDILDSLTRRVENWIFKLDDPHSPRHWGSSGNDILSELKSWRGVRGDAADKRIELLIKAMNDGIARLQENEANKNG